MADSSEVVVDWFACCGCENRAAKFVKSGIDSIKKLRDLEKDQFQIIESDWGMYWNFHTVQDRTSTGEELSREVSVSVFVNVLYMRSGVCRDASSLGWHAESIAAL